MPFSVTTQLPSFARKIIASNLRSLSNSLKERRGLNWIQKNSGIPEGTATARFNKDPKNVAQATRVTSSSTMDAWFDCGGSLEVVEEVVGLGNYGRTLTVLWGEALADLDDEEEARRTI